MENSPRITEDFTFNALKYKRYTPVDTMISGQFIPAGVTYWVNDAGLLHREDGPAVEDLDGSKAWFQNGLKHREGGPAVIQKSGTKYWFRLNYIHREDGPAVEWAYGAKEWWFNGKYIKSSRD